MSQGQHLHDRFYSPEAPLSKSACIPSNEAVVGMFIPESELSDPLIDALFQQLRHEDNLVIEGPFNTKLCLEKIARGARMGERRLFDNDI